MLEIEKRFGKRSMGVLEVIYEDDGTDSEVTMVEAGAKTVLHWNLEKRSILSGALISPSPTDDDESDEIIPYLAYGKQFSDKATFQSSARVIVPVDDTDEGEVELAGVVHYLWAGLPRAVFPALEVTATVPFDSEDEDTVQWTVLPQVRFGLTKRRARRAQPRRRVPSQRPALRHALPPAAAVGLRRRQLLQGLVTPRAGCRAIRARGARAGTSSWSVTLRSKCAPKYGSKWPIG